MLENLSGYLLKLFFVVNPHLVVPFFLSYTQNYTNSERKKVGKKMCLYGLFLALSFAIFGEMILNLLGVSRPAFRIGGGLLLGVAAWNLLYGKNSPDGSESNVASNADISLCPLAFPMFIGPATITTMMGMLQDAKGLQDQALVVFTVFLIILGTYILLLFGTAIMKVLGRSGSVILEKVGGILLIVMCIEMIFGGARTFFGGNVVKVDTQSHSEKSIEQK